MVDLTSEPTSVRHTPATVAAHSLELKVSRCRTFQFPKCFLPALVWMWNDFPYSVFDTGTLDGFKGAVKRWLLPWIVFSCLPWRMCLWGWEINFKKFVFTTWARAAGLIIIIRNKNVSHFIDAIINFFTICFHLLIIELGCGNLNMQTLCQQTNYFETTIKYWPLTFHHKYIWNC